MNSSIYEDPVVAEIHAIRESLLDECGGDIHEYRKRVRRRQAATNRRVITSPLRKRTEQTDEAKPK